MPQQIRKRKSCAGILTPPDSPEAGPSGAGTGGLVVEMVVGRSPPRKSRRLNNNKS